MWSNEPPTPSSEFQRQVEKTDVAINHLRNEISRLDAAFKVSGDEEIQKQLEFLKGYTTSYKGIKHVLKLKEIAMSQKWDDLDVDEQQERDELRQSYGKMIKLMNIYEQNTYKVIAAPPGWFSTSIAQWESWVRKNPWKTLGGVACGAGVCAALGALVGLGRDFAACGFSCQAGAVGLHALVGGALGLGVGLGVCVVGVFILAAVWGGHTCCKRRKPQKEKTDIQKIEEMVEALKKIPENEFAKQMDSIITECSAMAKTIPASEDWKCPMCHAEGDEVKEPVKAHGCKHSHVLCKSCWEEYTKTPAGCEGKCMLCFQ